MAAQFYFGNIATQVDAANTRALRQLGGMGEIGKAGGSLARAANSERLRREGEEATIARVEEYLGQQAGRAQEQAASHEDEAGQAASGAPTQAEPDAPGSTTDQGESSIHRVARTVLSPFGMMNRTPPGVERPEIKIARLEGKAAAREERIRMITALQSVLSRSPDPGAILERAGVTGFGKGSLPVRGPGLRSWADAAAADLTPEQEQRVERLLRIQHPGPGAGGGASKPPAAVATRLAVAAELKQVLGRDPLPREVTLVMLNRAGKLDPAEAEIANALEEGKAPAAEGGPTTPTTTGQYVSPTTKKAYRLE